MPCAGGAQRVRGKIKLPRQFIPPLPPLNELSDETSHPPINRLEKQLLRLFTPYSLEAEHFAVNIVRFYNPVFDWAAAFLTTFFV